MLNILILISSLFSQTSPISLSAKSTLVDYSGERYFQFIINLKSVEKEAFKYSLKIDFPKELELIEGNTSYSGDFNGLAEKNYSIILNPLKETTGSIKISVNFYKGDEATASSSNRTYLTNYSVIKNSDSKLVFNTNELSLVQKTKNQAVNEEMDKKLDENSSDSTTDSEEQQFKVSKRSRALAMFRYFLLLVSLSILGFFIYRVRRK